MTLPRPHLFTLSPVRAAALGLAPLLLAACGGGSDGDATPRYLVGGQVAGLQQGTLVLHNNGGDALRIAAGTSDFSFPTLLEAGQPYAVTVATQPAGQRCTVSAGTGVVQDDVRDVRVQCTPAATPDPDPGPGPGAGEGGGSGTGEASACFNAKLVTPGTRYRWHTAGKLGDGGANTYASVVQEMTVKGGATFAGTSDLIADGGQVTTTIAGVVLAGEMTHYYRRQDTAAGPVLISYGSAANLRTDSGIQIVTQTVTNPPSELRKYTLAPGGSYAHYATSAVTSTVSGGGQSTTVNTTDVEDYTIQYLGQESVTVPAGTFQACRYSVRFADEPHPWDEYIGVGSGLPLVMTGVDSEGNRVRLEMQADSEVNGVPVRNYDPGMH